MDCIRQESLAFCRTSENCPSKFPYVKQIVRNVQTCIGENFARIGRCTVRLLQSLMRGLKALDILTASAEPMRLTRIAEELGIEKSNASHILKSLVAAGYAVQDETRRYRAARDPESRKDGHSLSEVVACKELCRPILQRLVEVTGECAHLAVLVDERVWYVDKVDSTLPLKVDHPIGSLAPLHCTALGKAFLAFGGAEIPTALPSHTAQTIVDRHVLNGDLEQARVRGFTMDDSEFAEGIRCVARPVFDSRDKMIAALGISGPSVRIGDSRMVELGQLVRKAGNPFLKDRP